MTSSNRWKRVTLAIGLATGFLLASLVGLGASRARADTGPTAPRQSYVGINGNACAYHDVAGALVDASDGDTVYISDINTVEHHGLIGRIEHDLTFVAATNNCQTESTTEAVLDGDGGSWAPSGGLAVISSNKTVTFTRIHLQNAQASLRGGVIHVEEDANLILDSSQVLSGTTGGEGGGINVNAGGLLWMKNGSVVYRNEVTDPLGEGAGVSVYSGTVFLDRSRVGQVGTGDGNVSAGNGGGLYLDQSALVMEDAYVLNNIAVQQGGGVLAVRDSSIFVYGDSAIGGYVHDYLGNNASDGGGVYLDEGSQLAMQDGSRLGFNTADYGGGVYATAGSYVRMYSTTRIYSNTATFGGGAYLTGTNTTMEVSPGSVRIEGNEAIAPAGGGTVANGGGVYATGEAELYAAATQFVGNGAELLGGAVYVAQDGAANPTTVLIYDRSVVSGNVAKYGGGLYLAHNGSQVLVDNAQIRSNAALTTGGGIRVGGDNFLLLANNTVVSGNVTYNDNGGGLAMSAGRVEISDALFQGNGAGLLSISNGGAIYQSGGFLTMTNSSLVDNAAQSGGGLLMFHSSAVLTNVHVISNTATASGGGIYGQLSTLEMGASFADCSPSALPDHTYCSEIRGNSADNFGGGIYFGLGGSTATIEDTAFLDNEGASDGEAFLVTDYTAVTVTNSLFSGHGVNSNPAVSVPGQDTYFTSINSTYAGNHHIPLSVTQDATTTLTLNIMWDNALPADIHSQAGLTSQCNDTQIGLGGSGDISVNPQFINLRGPYRLKHTSPAIDRCIGTTNHDLDGNPRPIDAIGGVSLFEHDIGAFEAYPPTFIPLALNNF